MPDFAARLRHHRERLGLSQQTLAERCGISWADQQAYEAGRLAPSASYLQALADAGLEVAYLTTGEWPRRCPEGMSMQEWTLLQNFEAVSPQVRAEVLRVLEDAAGSEGPSTQGRPEPRGPTQVVDLTRWRQRHLSTGRRDADS